LPQSTPFELVTPVAELEASLPPHATAPKTMAVPTASARRSIAGQ